MKTKRKLKLIGAVGAVAVSGLAPQAVAQHSRFDELAGLPFHESYPTSEASAWLYDELQW